MPIEPTAMGSIAIEVTIDATPESVWTALTKDIGQWWPSDFYAGGTEGSRSFLLEAFPGGRMYESWSDTEGLLWGTVQTVAIGRKLEISGLAFPQWGGPSLWLGSWDLEGKGGVTKVRFTESTIGRVDEAGLAEKEKGWRYLYGDVLKKHCEG